MALETPSHYGIGVRRKRYETNNLTGLLCDARPYDTTIDAGHYDLAKQDMKEWHVSQRHEDPAEATVDGPAAATR